MWSEFAEVRNDLASLLKVAILRRPATTNFANLSLTLI